MDMLLPSDIDLMQKGRPLSAKAMPFVPGRVNAPVQGTAGVGRNEVSAAQWAQEAQGVMRQAREQHVLSERRVGSLLRELADVQQSRAMDNRVLLYDLDSINANLNQLLQKVSLLKPQVSTPTTLGPLSGAGLAGVATPTEEDDAICSLEKEFGLSITGDHTPNSRYTGAHDDSFVTPDEKDTSGFVMNLAHSSSPDTSLDGNDIAGLDTSNGILKDFFVDK